MIRVNNSKIRYDVFIVHSKTDNCQLNRLHCTMTEKNKKHLENVGSIRHNKPPHAHSPDVASGTVARRLRLDVHDNDDNA